MFGRFQFLSDMALGWFIYTPEGRETAKKLIEKLGKEVESEMKKLKGEKQNENTKTCI